MAMLGLTVNVSLGLWERSTVDAVAYDAALRVATAPVPTFSDPAAVRAQALDRRPSTCSAAHADDVRLRLRRRPRRRRGDGCSTCQSPGVQACCRG